MTASPVWRLPPALVALLLAGLPAAWLADAVVALRLAASAACLLAVGLRFVPGRHGSWLSPLPVLAVSAAFFYAVVPALTAPIALAEWQHLLGASNIDAFRRFPASEAEVLVLQFALLAVGIDLVVEAGGPRSIPALSLPGWATALLSWVVAALALAYGVLGMGLAPRAALLGNLIDTYGPSLAAVSVLALTEHALASRRPWNLAAFLLLLLAMASAGVGKPAVFLMVAVVLRVLAHGLPARRLVVGAAALVLAGLVVMAVVDRVRYARALPVFDLGVLVERTGHMLLFKGAVRQAETGACLAGVAERHRTQSPGRDFWLLLPRAVVPRALWPEKPTLSLGSQYFERYCGQKPEDVSLGSASITLIGQPLAAGGFRGLRLGQAALVVGLAAATLAARRRPLSRLAFAAVLPWLVDFDQDYALYWANALKSTVIMAPMLLLLWLAVRRAPPASDPQFRPSPLHRRMGGGKS
jgi:hypothetical protein